MWAVTCRASILTGKLDFNKKCWDGVSSGAKDFVKSLLTRDPADRPTAKQALYHPWIRGKVAERSIGQPLGRSVIQRIQVLVKNVTPVFAGTTFSLPSSSLQFSLLAEPART